MENATSRTVHCSDAERDSSYKKWDDEVRWNDPRGFVAVGNAYAYLYHGRAGDYVACLRLDCAWAGFSAVRRVHEKFNFQELRIR